MVNGLKEPSKVKLKIHMEWVTIQGNYNKFKQIEEIQTHLVLTRFFKKQHLVLCYVNSFQGIWKYTFGG